MAKRNKTNSSLVTDCSGFESILMKSENDALKGVLPQKSKPSSQDSVLDILGEEPADSVNLETKNGILDWGDIPSSSKFHNKSVSNWTSKDLFIYLKSEVSFRSGKKWNSSAIAIGIQTLRQVREYLQEITEKDIGSETIKKYIDWFIANEMNSEISKKGEFYISSIIKKNIIKKFVKHDNLSSSFVNNTEGSATLDRDNIGKIFQTSKMLFITRYGVVVSTNWLVSSGKFSTAEEAMAAVKNMLNLYSNKSEIKKTTEFLSPYNTKYKIPGLDELIKSVDAKVEFRDNVSLLF